MTPQAVILEKIEALTSTLAEMKAEAKEDRASWREEIRRLEQVLIERALSDEELRSIPNRLNRIEEEARKNGGLAYEWKKALISSTTNGAIIGIGALIWALIQIKAR